MQQLCFISLTLCDLSGTTITFRIFDNRLFVPITKDSYQVSWGRVGNKKASETNSSHHQLGANGSQETQEIFMMEAVG